jgi:hypothetical protein
LFRKVKSQCARKSSHQDSELNKQEQLMVKKFISTSNSSTLTRKINSQIIVCTIFFIGCHIGISIIIIMAYDKVFNQIDIEASHVDSFFVSLSYLYGAMGSFFQYVGSTYYTNSISPILQSQRAYFAINL